MHPHHLTNSAVRTTHSHLSENKTVLLVLQTEADVAQALQDLQTPTARVAPETISGNPRTCTAAQQYHDLTGSPFPFDQLPFALSDDERRRRISEFEQLGQLLMELGGGTRPMSEHPLASVGIQFKPGTYRQDIFADHVDRALRAARTAHTLLGTTTADVRSLLATVKLQIPYTIGEAKAVADALALAFTFELPLPESWYQAENLQGLVNSVERLATEAADQQKLRADLLNFWNPTIFDVDITQLVTAWNDAQKFRILSTGLTGQDIANFLGSHMRNRGQFAISVQAIPQLLAQLSNYHQREQAINELGQQLAPYIPGARHPNGQWNIGKMRGWIENVRSNPPELMDASLCIRILTVHEEKRKSYSPTFEGLKNIQQVVHNWVDATYNLALFLGDITGDNPQATLLVGLLDDILNPQRTIELLTPIHPEAHKLTTWIRWCALIRTLFDGGYGSPAQAISESNSPWQVIAYTTECIRALAVDKDEYETPADTTKPQVVIATFSSLNRCLRKYPGPYDVAVVDHWDELFEAARQQVQDHAGEVVKVG